MWAFSLGYVVSSLIQVLVTRHRMQELMGKSGSGSVAMGTFFGFISSSCSFAALSTTRALFQKGAGLAPALAFMLASTNLVIELGFVIALFLSWQFVVGEYVGGLLLILFVWLAVALFPPKKLIESTRKRLAGDDEHEQAAQENWRKTITSISGWQRIARTYVMEWQMVWKDVLIGFTVAGIIATFVPDSFFQALFLGSATEQAVNPGFGAVLQQAVTGPIVAFFTFIGSMGNIPLAAILYDHGVSFAGVMAFIFSDLVVLPVIRINIVYYGWKMAIYILLLLLSGLVLVSIFMHYLLSLLQVLPEGAQGMLFAERNYFAMNTGFFLNIVFLLLSAVLVGFWWKAPQPDAHSHEHGSAQEKPLTTLLLQGLVAIVIIWLAGGLVIPPLLA